MSAHSFEHYEPVGYYQRGPIEDRVAKELGQHMYVSPPPLPIKDCTPRETKVQHFTPGYAGWPVGELMHFGTRARAESLRLILHHAGLPYTLKTVSFEEWPALQRDVPNNCLPAFTPDGESTFTGTADIAKYLAKVSGIRGLLPQGAGAESAQALFEMAMTAAVERTDSLLNTIATEEASAQLATHVAEVVDVLKTIAEPHLLQSGGPFFGGKGPHYGDFGVWPAVDNLCRLEPTVLDRLGVAWRVWYDAFAQLKGVAAYLSSRPAAGSGKVGKVGSIIYETALDAPQKSIRDYTES